MLYQCPCEDHSGWGKENKVEEGTEEEDQTTIADALKTKETVAIRDDRIHSIFSDDLLSYVYQITTPATFRNSCYAEGPRDL